MKAIFLGGISFPVMSRRLNELFICNNPKAFKSAEDLWRTMDDSFRFIQ